MSDPNNKIEDIFDNVDPVTEGGVRKPASAPLSLEQVIAQKKAKESLPIPKPSNAEPPSQPLEQSFSSSPFAEPQASDFQSPPSPSPNKNTEDIFADVSFPQSAKPLTGKEFRPQPIVKQPPLFKNPKFYIMLALVFGLVFLAVGGWFFYNQFINTPSPKPFIVEPEPDTKATETEDAQSEAFIPEPIVEIDSDLDGLTDEEERMYGTNPYEVDSDFDGLSDYIEVKIFKTDPNNPDTDGDGFTDGEEVKNGYNPNGEGKLLIVP